MKKGYLAGISAYFWWGLSPLYWKLLVSIPSIETLGLRVLWALPYIFLFRFIRKSDKSLLPEIHSLKQLLPYVISALLLAANWFIWIWSMNNNYVVEASLGYFINPLVNVLLGVALLKEHIRRLQWFAIILAAIGVLNLTLNYGQFPWIALTLAGSFAFYGYIRKTVKLGALDGLTIEIFVMFLPAIILLSVLGSQDNPTFFSIPFETHILVPLAGLITVVPLVVFAYGARILPYSTLGFLQYIAPTLQFLLGVFLYNEEFTQERFIGFAFIWLALAVYSFENLYFLIVKNRLSPTRKLFQFKWFKAK